MPAQRLQLLRNDARRNSVYCFSKKKGRLCARFYQRADGTMLTQNCPVGFRGALLRATRLATASLSAIIALSQANSAKAHVQSAKSLVQIQPVSPELTVEVVDPSGAVITNAKISVTDEGSKDSFETTADERGRAALSLRSNASYSIKISSPGFASRTLHLQAPFAKFVTVRLELGLMGEVVEIVQDIETPSIQTSLETPAPAVVPDIQTRTPAPHIGALHYFFSKLRHIF
jgi:hypothetical protein